MINKDSLDQKIKNLFDGKVIEITPIGSGISGNVYKASITAYPYVVAIKLAKDAELLQRESNYIKYIYDRVDIKLPKIYDINIETDNNYIIMEYFDGMACNDEKVLTAPLSVRQSIAKEIADNIAKLQEIRGTKYGDLLTPMYDNWHDYYRPFVHKMMDCAAKLVAEGVLVQYILDTMHLALENYDKVFEEPITAPTLMHGDYWAANIMVDKNFRLIGVVDPFNALWADSEYEMFALNAVYGDKLPVLEEFVKTHTMSSKFPVKNEFYFLFSEVYWVTIMRHDNNQYLTDISNRLIHQLKEYKII